MRTRVIQRWSPQLFVLAIGAIASACGSDDAIGVGSSGTLSDSESGGTDTEAGTTGTTASTSAGTASATATQGTATTTSSGTDTDGTDTDGTDTDGTDTDGSNTPPSAEAANVQTDEDVAVDIMLEASDPDGDLLTFRLLTAPTRGALSGTAPDLRYTPDADYFGSDRFTFEVVDGRGGFDVAAVDITIAAVNDLPETDDDSYTVAGCTLDVDAAAGVLANDEDLESGTNLTVEPYSGPTTAGGTVVLAADGSFAYTPAQGFRGVDGFDYTAIDPDGGRTPGRVTITVSGDVIFVRNDAAAGGNGSAMAPFATLAAGLAAADPNDTLFVFAGDGTPTGLTGSFALEPGQQLIGESIGLSLCGAEVVAPGATPRLRAEGGPALRLAEGAAVRGFVVEGAGQVGLEIASVATAAVDRVEVEAASIGLRAEGVTGLVRVAALTITDPTDVGIDLANVTGAAAGVDIDGLAVTAAAGGGLRADTVTGLAIGGDAAIAVTGGAALDLRDTAAGLEFATLTSAASATQGLRLENVTGTLDATTFEVDGATSVGVEVIDGGAFITLDGDVTHAGATALRIAGTTAGTFVLDGDVLAPAGGVVVSAAAGDVSLLGATRLGSDVAPVAGVALDRAGGTGLLRIADLEAFSTGAEALRATGRGTVRIDGGRLGATGAAAAVIEPEGSGTVGPAVDVHLERLDVQGSPTEGLRLRGTAGLFELTGTGAAGTGGTIAGAGADAVSLTNVAGVTLRGLTVTAPVGSAVRAEGASNVALRTLTVTDAGNSCLSGTGVREFGLYASTLSGCGDADGEGAIMFATVGLVNLAGAAVIDGVTVSNTRAALVVDNNIGDPLDLDIIGVDFQGGLGTAQDLVVFRGAGEMDVSITGTLAGPARLRGATRDGLRVDAVAGAADIELTLNNVAIEGNTGAGLMLFGNGGRAAATFTVGNGAGRGLFGNTTNVMMSAAGATGRVVTSFDTVDLAGPSQFGIRAQATNAGAIDGTFRNVRVQGASIAGVNVTANNAGGAVPSSVRLDLANATIDQHPAAAISAFANLLGAIDLKVANSRVESTGSTAIRVDADAASADVCVDLASNSLFAGPTADDVRLDGFAGATFDVAGYSGGGSDEAAVAAYVKAAQTNAAAVTVDVNATGGTFGGAACTAPSLP